MSNDYINQIEIEEYSKKNVLFSIIESLLFVSGEPLTCREISSIIECEVDYTNQIMKELSIKYDNIERGIKLIRINNSYQLTTKSGNFSFIQKLLKTNSRQSLSQASLETLSIVAYNQPITRIAVDEIRGVKSDSAIITLVDKGLIKESGRMEVPGRPILYVTTDAFLKYFGLESIKNLQSIEEIVRENNNDFEQEGFNIV